MLNKVFNQHLFKAPLSCLLLTLLLATNAWAVDINASVDRNPVSLNDSFKLIFSSTAAPDDDPDFAPLERDFEVLNQQKSSQSSWVNGKSKKSISWTLDVMAKRVGTLQIPVIEFGDDSSQALGLTVLAASANNDLSPTEELFIEVSATPQQPYVQAQVIYTMRLFQRVQIAQASLTEPAVPGAIVEKLGEDSQYNTEVNGVRYAVIERQYAIFPQQSGPLEIAPLQLTAQVVSGGRRSRFGSIFDSQRTQTKRVFSEAVSLNVLPAPSDFKGQHWLAAQQVYIEQSWSNKDLSVSVGEPLTRTLTLLAKGVNSSQLPDLTREGVHSALKTYPDQPMLKDKKDPDGMTALREQKVALIPSQAGQYVLPEIQVPWFNTQTQTMETATIPAVTITAIAKDTSSSPAITLNEPQVTLPNLQSPPLDVAPTQNSMGYWPWLALILGLGWALTLIWLFKSRSKVSQTKTASENQNVPLKQAVKALQEACAANDPKKAKRAFLNWGRVQFNADTEESIALQCSAECQAEIKHLNESLYAKKRDNWKGDTLAALVLEASRSLQNKSTEEDALEPLNRL